ncbi:ribose-5-phosphate isomerase A [Halobacillus rhizosphaerae]|uniref:ribose-5-phosphate isomerase A n=1 Tax=Halobacillus rhizosphaerae TaxID=3064889 RepID=UPI00398A7E5F
MIPSSETALNCVRLGIPQSTLLDCRPDWGFDGADDKKRLIKVRGGAMLTEKLVMASSIPGVVEADLFFDYNVEILTI